MIYVQEKTLKIAKKYIPGQIQSVSVTEEGKLADKKNKKTKKTKTNVPTGYEAAKIEIKILFEESSNYTAQDMVRNVQSLFKKPKQKRQKKYRITEPMCNARGIHEVYFNGFSTTSTTSESWYIGTLSLVAPKIVGIKSVKTKAARAKAKAAAQKAAVKKRAAAKKRKTTKKVSKSPAKDTKNTSAAKKKAKKLVRKKK